MSRIQATFTHLSESGQKALIPFITAGDPSAALTVPLLHTLVNAGANILELGIPFSDPMADGPTIQRASERALAQNISLQSVLGMVSEFRKTDTRTPIVLMGYANPIESMGQEAFAKAAASAGVDGVLVVDYPPEESALFAATLKREAIDPIYLLAPTSTEARIRKLSSLASGYVYYVSLTGVTGAGHLDTTAVMAQVPRIREILGLPVGVGFGIRDAETAGRIASVADAVVVGSRIIEEIEHASPETVCSRVHTLITDLRRGIHQAGVHP